MDDFPGVSIGVLSGILYVDWGGFFVFGVDAEPCGGDFLCLEWMRSHVGRLRLG